jgi:hypothetical protein
MAKPSVGSPSASRYYRCLWPTDTGLNTSVYFLCFKSRMLAQSMISYRTKISNVMHNSYLNLIHCFKIQWSSYIPPVKIQISALYLQQISVSSASYKHSNYDLKHHYIYFVFLMENFPCDRNCTNTHICTHTHTHTHIFTYSITHTHRQALKGCRRRNLS